MRVFISPDRTVIYGHTHAPQPWRSWQNMTSCLLVIDAQQSFIHRPYFAPHDVPAYLDAQNRLIEGAARKGIPVVRIFHVEADPSSAFSLESGHVRPLEGLIDFKSRA